MRRILALGALCLIGGLMGLTPARTDDRKPAADYARFEKKLSNDQAILHALDRLTFGPRPGDLAAVKRLGLKKWIDLQLHPEQIAENPELDRHIKPLESLSMTQAYIEGDAQAKKNVMKLI